jgi:hypothetical protein
LCQLLQIDDFLGISLISKSGFQESEGLYNETPLNSNYLNTPYHQVNQSQLGGQGCTGEGVGK